MIFLQNVFVCFRAVWFSVFLFKLVASLQGAISDVKGFTIQKDDAGLHVVQTRIGGGAIAHCAINFTTSSTWRRRAPLAGKATVKIPHSGKSTTKEILETLKGKCRSAKKGFWSYQICFGVSVKQIHRGGVGFFFGRNAQPLDFPTAKSQTYIEGDLCASSGKEGNRKAIVTYMCGGFKIVAVSETSSCTYSLVVKIPEMCGAQGFPLVESKFSRGRKRHRRGITIRHTLHQNWYIEITPFDDGKSVACGVHVADVAAHDLLTSPYFKDFSVTMWTTGNRAQQPFLYKSHRARGLHRQLLREKELAVDAGGTGKSNIVVVQPQQYFGGLVQEFKIVGSINHEQHRGGGRLFSLGGGLLRL